MASIGTTRPRISSRPSSGTPPLHRITVDEYDRITAAGALEDPSRIELIDGYMVEKMAEKPGHTCATTQTMRALESRLPPNWPARKEEPVRIPDYDEPEPDITVVRGSVFDYRQRTPAPADVALLVETSETTLRQDRGPKRTVYARAGIPVYWIVNLVDRQVEVCTRPDGEGRYLSRKVFKPGQQVLVVVAGQELPAIPVDEILP